VTGKRSSNLLPVTGRYHTAHRCFIVRLLSSVFEQILKHFRSRFSLKFNLENKPMHDPHGFRFVNADTVAVENFKRITVILTLL